MLSVQQSLCVAVGWLLTIDDEVSDLLELIVRMRDAGVEVVTQDEAFRRAELSNRKWLEYGANFPPTLFFLAMSNCALEFASQTHASCRYAVRHSCIRVPMRIRAGALTCRPAGYAFPVCPRKWPGTFFSGAA